MERCGTRIMGVRVHIAPLSVIRYTGRANGSADKGVSLGGDSRPLLHISGA